MRCAVNRASTCWWAVNFQHSWHTREISRSMTRQTSANPEQGWDGLEVPIIPSPNCRGSHLHLPLLTNPTPLPGIHQNMLWGREAWGAVMDVSCPLVQNSKAGVRVHVFRGTHPKVNPARQITSCLHTAPALKGVSSTGPPSGGQRFVCSAVFAFSVRRLCSAHYLNTFPLWCILLLTQNKHIPEYVGREETRKCQALLSCFTA